MNGPGAVLGLFSQGVGVQRLDVFGAVIKETGRIIHFALGFFQRLAMFHAQYAAHFFLVVLQRIADAFQPPASGFQGVGVGQPKRGFTRFHRRHHVRLGHGRKAGNDFARRGIVDVKRVTFGRIRPATADIASQLFKQG